MLRQKIWLVKFPIYIIDISLTVASFFLAYWIRDTYLSVDYGHLAPIKGYLWLLLLIIPAWTFLFKYFVVYESLVKRPLWWDPYKIFKVVFWGVLLMGTLVFLFKLQYVSRLFIIFFGLANFTLLSLEKLIIRSTVSYIRKKGRDYRNVLIVGSGETAKEVAGLIEDHKRWGMRMM